MGTEKQGSVSEQMWPGTPTSNGDNPVRTGEQFEKQSVEKVERRRRDTPY